MKKILIICCLALLFTGCSMSLNDHAPEDAINTYFEKYRKKDDNVITELINSIDEAITGEDQKEKYQKLMEKQYDQFSYVIKEVKKSGDEATAKVEVTVLDYRKKIDQADLKLKEEPEKFNDDNGSFSEEKFTNYKLDEMDKVNTTKSYVISLNLTKENGMWAVEQLSDDDLSKLHGLY